MEDCQLCEEGRRTREVWEIARDPENRELSVERETKRTGTTNDSNIADE